MLENSKSSPFFPKKINTKTKKNKKKQLLTNGAGVSMPSCLLM